MCDNKRIVMCGCHVIAEHLIEPLILAGVNFCHFIALTPEQAERYSISGYFDLRPIAARYSIPVYIPKTYSLTDSADFEFFEQQRFDLLIQGGWQRLFPDRVLTSLSIGAIGTHGSADFLPKGRGRSPLIWSTIEGAPRFFLHLFLMKPGADDGDVFAVDDFDITPFDDIETLMLKVSVSTKRLLLAHLPALLAGSVKVVPQVGEPTYFPKRSDKDGLIDWTSMSLHQLHNFIRAQTRPYPGAIGKIGDKFFRIWRSRPFDTRIAYPSAQFGDVVERFGSRLVVNCKGGLLLIEDYEEIPAPSWL